MCVLNWAVREDHSEKVTFESRPKYWEETSDGRSREFIFQGKAVNSTEAPKHNMLKEQKNSKYGWGLQKRGGSDLVTETTRNLIM